MFKFVCGLFVACLCGCISQVDQSQIRPARDIYGPAMEIEKKDILIGSISSQQAEIKGVIPIFNPGSETLEIRKVTGPCACFKGYSGDKMIAPGQGGEIEVRFDPSQIQAGPGKCLVRIETNDPNKPVSEVYVTFDIQRSSEQEQNRILRAELSQLRSEIKALRKDVDLLKNPISKQQPCQAQKPTVEDTKIYDIPVGNSPVLGSSNAAVTIVEFSDFQCGYCIKEYPILKQVLDEYRGKVRLVFKHFPLDFHKQAPAVHAATELAFRQKGNDTFWKLCDMVQAEPKKLEPAVLKIYAQALGLDTAEMEKTWSDNQATAELLKADKELAARCNVRGTPTIFVNGLKLSDRSIDGYRSRIEQILSEGKKLAVKTK